MIDRFESSRPFRGLAGLRMLTVSGLIAASVAVVGCSGGGAAVDASAADSGKTALQTKGAAAKEFKSLRKGVMPPKGKSTPG